MRTANPALNNQVFIEAIHDETKMTLQGTVGKTFFLLCLVVGSALVPWVAFGSGASGLAMGLAIPAALGGFVVALVTIFKKTWAPYTTPVYAVLEGVFLGAISAWFNAQYPGIVVQAVGLTFGTLGGLLMAYTSGMIRATENFKLGVVAATGGIMLLYLTSFVLGFFGIDIPYIHGSGPIGILFSMFVVVIAALNLVLDFDFIENGCEAGAPKYMEWYAAFGLLVTLVWLYLEILRLLAKLRRR